MKLRYCFFNRSTLDSPARTSIIRQGFINSETIMANISKGNAVIGQSGGPTAVINQSLVGVILESRKHAHIEKLLGARHGVRGIVSEDFIELDKAPEELLER